MKIAYLGCVFGGMIVGVVLGWNLASDPPSAKIGGVPPPVATATVTAPQALPAATHTKADGTFATRAETLRWLQRHKAMAPVGVFSAEDTGTIDARFAEVFALTADEKARLERAALQARRQLDDIRVGQAKVMVSPDNLHARVEFPAVPEEGGRIYNELWRAFHEVLGAERVGYFDVLSGEKFEEAFHAFGVNGERFELAKNVREDGAVWIEYSCANLYDEPGSARGGSGRFSPATFAQAQPALAKALPPSFLQSPVPPQ